MGTVPVTQSSARPLFRHAFYGVKVGNSVGHSLSCSGIHCSRPRKGSDKFCSDDMCAGGRDWVR